MSKKTVDLQPWLDYFEMLQAYEQKGFLEVNPSRNEAYVTNTALFAMSDDGSPRALAVADTVRRLRAYAGWRSMQGKVYLEQPFAVHIVKDDEPHDLVFTLLVTRRRRWWCPWRRTDRIRTIKY